MEEAAYVEAWRRYRLWARLRLVALLGLVPFVGGVGGRGQPLLLAWVAFLCATHAIAIYFSCPRCRAPFFYKRIVANTFAARCVHCGLPKWAINAEGARGPGRSSWG